MSLRNIVAETPFFFLRDKAKRAQDKLKAKRPGSKMGFLRQRPDGTTSLTILTGEPGIVPGTEKDRPVSLGTLLGKVNSTSSSLLIEVSFLEATYSLLFNTSHGILIGGILKFLPNPFIQPGL